MEILEQIKRLLLKKVLIDPNTECWLWQGHVGPDGYARSVFLNKKQESVHRVSYLTFVGEIPGGMAIDHICRNRKCCNPKHLQVLSVKENTLLGIGPTARNRKKTHCPRGHAFDESNTYIDTRNARKCRACVKIDNDESAQRKRVGLQPRRKTVLERINAKLTLADNGCKLWTGKKAANGYGQLQVGGKIVFAHRALYEEIQGDVLAGFVVHRKCKNRLCCALDHLYIAPSGAGGEEIKLVKSGGIS